MELKSEISEIRYSRSVDRQLKIENLIFDLSKILADSGFPVEICRSGSDYNIWIGSENRNPVWTGWPNQNNRPIRIFNQNQIPDYIWSVFCQIAKLTELSADTEIESEQLYCQYQSEIETELNRLFAD